MVQTVKLMKISFANRKYNIRHWALCSIVQQPIDRAGVVTVQLKCIKKDEFSKSESICNYIYQDKINCKTGHIGLPSQQRCSRCSRYRQELSRVDCPVVSQVPCTTVSPPTQHRSIGVDSYTVHVLCQWSSLFWNCTVRYTCFCQPTPDSCRNAGLSVCQQRRRQDLLRGGA